MARALPTLEERKFILRNSLPQCGPHPMPISLFGNHALERFQATFKLDCFARCASFGWIGAAFVNNEIVTQVLLDQFDSRNHFGSSTVRHCQPFRSSNTRRIISGRLG